MYHDSSDFPKKSCCNGSECSRCYVSIKLRQDCSYLRVYRNVSAAIFVCRVRMEQQLLPYKKWYQFLVWIFTTVEFSQLNIIMQQLYFLSAVLLQVQSQSHRESYPTVADRSSTSLNRYVSCFSFSLLIFILQFTTGIFS